jgi:hypothetical protein
MDWCCAIRRCILVRGTVQSTFLNAAELNHILAPVLMLVPVPTVTILFWDFHRTEFS